MNQTINFRNYFVDLHLITQFGKSLNFIILSGNIRIPQSAISDFETSTPKRNMMIWKNENFFITDKYYY